MRGVGSDGLLKCEELPSDAHSDEEDASAIEGVERSELNLEVGITPLAQVVAHAFVLLGRGAAEKLQRYVPGFWRGPAKVAGLFLYSELMDCGGEIVCSSGSQRYAKKEAHPLHIELRGD
jgi:hypothetical protein